MIPMDDMAGLGVLIFFLAGILLVSGIIVLFIGAVNDHKKTRKIALYILLAGGLILLASFTLCSMGSKL